MSEDKKEPNAFIKDTKTCLHTSVVLKRGKYFCAKCDEELDQKFQRSIQTY